MKTIHGCEVLYKVEELITNFAKENGFNESIHTLEYNLTGLYFYIGNIKYHIDKHGKIVNVIRQSMIDNLTLIDELG